MKVIPLNIFPFWVFFKFLSVGLITAIFYISSFSVLWKIINFPYQIAITFAYVASIIFYFFAHKYFTFKNKNNITLNQLFKYVTMVILNYLITLIIMHICVENIHFSPYLGMILAIGSTTLSGYMMSKNWVFAK